MKSSFPLLVYALFTMGSASGATILLTDIRPSFTESSTSTVSGSSNNGTLSTISPSAIPVFHDTTTSGSSIPFGSYGVRVAGITVGADVGIILQFNLTVAASAGDGILIRRATSSPGRGWAVDTDMNGGGNERFQLNSGESITFTLSNITLSGGTEDYDVAFEGFSDALFVADPSGSGTFTSGITGIMTGTSGTGYARDLDMSFSVTQIPETSTPVMGGICMAFLLTRRHRRERDV